MCDSFRLIGNKPQKSGFTLIEVLVVAVIVAVLAAFLFPAFGNAKKSAQEAKCIGNVKTMTNAYLAYVADNNGLFPKRPPQYPNVAYAEELIPNYLPQELLCPLYAESMPLSNRPSRGFRYSINDNLRFYFSGIASVPSAPSRTVLACEMYLMSTGLGDTGGTQLNWTATGLNQGGVPQTHFDGLNLGFLDSHVELVKNPRNAAGEIDWKTPPTYGKTYDSGLYYHGGQFSGMAGGRTHW